MWSFTLQQIQMKPIYLCGTDLTGLEVNTVLSVPFVLQMYCNCPIPVSLIDCG